MSTRRGIIATFFVASGAAGLIYQVVWTRELVLLFGNTTQAIVTAVAAFLAGLGIGALLGARLARHLTKPLGAYAVLEMSVGAVALLTPLSFQAIGQVFPGIYLSLPPLEAALMRFVLSFLALMPATILMGMTLPVLTRHYVRSDNAVGSGIGLLYGANTLGAVLGTVASGFVLIELLGLQETTYVAVFFNLSIGLGALILYLRSSDSIVPAIGGDQRARHDPLSNFQRWLLVVTGISGFASLSYEVLWTRVLMQGTGGLIYFFVSVLAVFLVGIAAGSLLFERIGDRRASPQGLAHCFAGIGILAIIPMAIGDRYGPAGFGPALLTMLPVTLLMGYAFPLTANLFVPRASGAGSGVGLMYGVNTLGSVVGTVVTGFFLVPLIGGNIALASLAIIETAVALTFVAIYGEGVRQKRLKVAVVAVASLVVLSSLPVVRMPFAQLVLSEVGVNNLHLEDDIATVDAVGGLPKHRQLYVAGMGMTALTIDTKLVAYVPKAWRPQSSSMLVIAFGMGSTFRSAINAGLRTDVVELSPSVPKVMPVFYPDASQYLTSPMGQIIINDGRNYVRLTEKKYDLIVIDAPPPSKGAGTVVLLTQEFYAEAKARLNTGGLLATFLPFDMTTCDFGAHLRTFRSEFSHASVFLSPGGNGALLMGSDSPLDLTPQNVGGVFGSAAAQRDLADAPDFGQLDANGWFHEIQAKIWMRDMQIDRYAGPGPMMTDDHPFSEYFLLRNQFDTECQPLHTP